MNYDLPNSFRESTAQRDHMEASEIKELIISSLQNLNEESEEEDRFEISEGMTLFGSSSALDSMALVTLIMDIEAAIQDASDLDISLVTEEAMSRSLSPFRTVDTLTGYVEELLATNHV